jgi:hypothetical protein
MLLVTCVARCCSSMPAVPSEVSASRTLLASPHPPLPRPLLGRAALQLCSTLEWPFLLLTGKSRSTT